MASAVMASVPPLSSTANRLQALRPLSRVAVAVALLLSFTAVTRSHSAHAAVPNSVSPEAALANQAVGERAVPVFPADGIYLYGQAPTADQIGVGYMVFEAVDQEIIGVLYMPNSSFDCFRGNVEDTALALNVTNSYTQETYPFEIALETSDTLATTGGTGAPLRLEGLHRLDTPSENDLRMLSVCKASFTPAQ